MSFTTGSRDTSFYLTHKLPGLYGASKTSFSLGHTKSYSTASTKEQCILSLFTGIYKKEEELHNTFALNI